MLGHGALGEHALGESAKVLSLVERRAQEKGGGTGLYFPGPEQLAEIRAAAQRAREAQQRKREERLRAERELRETIEKNYLISIGAWVEPWEWPDLPHPEVDISDLAFRIGGEELQGQFDRLLWEAEHAKLQYRIEAEEEEIAILMAAA